MRFVAWLEVSGYKAGWVHEYEYLRCPIKFLGSYSSPLILCVIRFLWTWSWELNCRPQLSNSGAEHIEAQKRKIQHLIGFIVEDTDSIKHAILIPDAATWDQLRTWQWKWLDLTCKLCESNIHGMLWNKSNPWRPHLVTNNTETTPGARHPKMTPEILCPWLDMPEPSQIYGESRVWMDLPADFETIVAHHCFRPSLPARYP